ncbi:MAG: glycosyltransferase, partial [Cyanobacteria bacterium P01_G01_bin.4]
MRLAYLTGEYPRATDTFIQREVEGLRQLGSTVLTCSIRPTGVEHLVGPEQWAEREGTFYVLPINPLAVLVAHLLLAVARPQRYLKTLALAASTSAAGIRATLYQLFYFLEAGVLAHKLQQERIEHLHNHIADSSCTVAMLAAELAEIPFSFTLHGPSIFYDPHRWRLDIKIAKAAFVSCISHFCRSQAMLFSSPDLWDKLHIIHCGVDPTVCSLKKHNCLGQNLLYVGRLAAAKGFPILLQSIAKLSESHPNLSLTVVGDGGERSE